MVLSTLYGRFIEVWRQKEAIVQKNRLTRLLSKCLFFQILARLLGENWMKR